MKFIQVVLFRRNYLKNSLFDQYISCFYLIFIIGFLFSSLAYSQEGKSFYLKGYNEEDLTPINRIYKKGYFTLEFSDSKLNEVFQDLKVLKYENYIDGLLLCEQYGLNNIFVLILKDSTTSQKFLSSSVVQDIKIASQDDLAFEDLPNDYYIPTFDEANQHESPGDSIRNDYLDLIQAPCAWELTKGDPDILVGVSDSYFTETHEDLTGKFDTIIGDGIAYDNNYKHGIEVASLIAGNTNNGKGTSSIGYNTRMIGAYNIGNDHITKMEDVKEIVRWSINNENKVRVINMSWGNRITDPSAKWGSEEDLLCECLRDQYNIVLVAAGHNKKNETTNNPNEHFSFPASYESVISVTTVGSRYPRENYDYTISNNQRVNLKDVLFSKGKIHEGKHRSHHILNDSLDLAAPSYDIFRATNTRSGFNDEDSIDEYEKTKGATSTSAPLVSGTAALMLSVNPDLTAVEVKNILKHTADRIDTIPHNQQYFGSGEDELSIPLGRLNAYKAVKMAKYFEEYGYDFDDMPVKVDLMIRDSEEDIGREPNTESDIFWDSPDIWVRNQPDGIEENQNPKYQPNQPNYIYVKVRNIGCDISSGEDSLNLYWTKATSSNSWPYSWNGQNSYPEGPLIGDNIGEVNIPPIAPGEEKIIEIPWHNVPNPDVYEEVEVDSSSPWHFCILARIESEDDPIKSNSSHNQSRLNNNVAQKNVTVINLYPGLSNQLIAGQFTIFNPFEDSRNFDLNFIPQTEEEGKKLYEEAEVLVTLDDDLMQTWNQGGSQLQDMVMLKENTFRVSGENASLKNLLLSQKEARVVKLQFHFLTKEITEKETYLYHAIQKNTTDGKVIGGESFEVNKHPRNLFQAQLSTTDKIDKEDEIIMEATSIDEPAIYNWYDTEGELLYEGMDFEGAVNVGEEYKLEVIALSDGYKDYAEIQFEYKPNRITTLTPNPTSGTVEVNYKINEGNNAYLAITSIDNPTITDNYMLNLEENITQIDLAAFSLGVYSIALIVDGQIADTKNLIKN